MTTDDNMKHGGRSAKSAHLQAAPNAAGNGSEPAQPTRRSKFDDFDAMGVHEETTGGASRTEVAIGIHKPSKITWFRSHPNPDLYSRKYAIVEWRLGNAIEEQPHIVVGPDLQSRLSKYTSYIRYTLCVTSSGKWFLCPNKVSKTGMENTWNDSLREALDIARQEWVNITPNLDAKKYDRRIATVGAGEPDWPQEPFRVLIERAFGESRVIDSEHHEVTRVLLLGPGSIEAQVTAAKAQAAEAVATAID